MTLLLIVWLLLAWPQWIQLCYCINVAVIIIIIMYCVMTAVLTMMKIIDIEVCVTIEIFISEEDHYYYWNDSNEMIEMMVMKTIQWLLKPLYCDHWYYSEMKDSNDNDDMIDNEQCDQ